MALLVFLFAIHLQLIFASIITIGDGTPSSCTESDFTAAINSYNENDIIQFNCSVNTYCDPIIIYLTQSYWIDKSVFINGAIYPGSNNKIILDGVSNTHRQFIVSNKDTFYGFNGQNINLTLANIILQNGGVGNNNLSMNCRDDWNSDPIPDCYVYKGFGGCIC